MATPISVIVDTGGAGDYPSLGAALGDSFGVGSLDFVAADVTVTCDCQATTGLADTTVAAFASMTLDDTHRLKIWTDPTTTGGDGLNGTYRHLASDISGSAKIYRFAQMATFNASYIDVEGIAFFRTETSGTNWGMDILQGNVNFTDCYFHFVGTGFFTGLGARFRNTGGPYNTGDTVCKNCIFVHTGSATGSYCVYLSATQYRVCFYHCIFVNTVKRSIYTDAAKAHLLTNCIEFSALGVFGNADAFDAASSNNGYSAATQDAFDINLGTNIALVFTNAAAYDYTHVAGSPALLAGTDLSATVPLDIAGNARSNPPDLGAHQLSPAETTPEYLLPYLVGSRNLGQVTDQWVMPQPPMAGYRLPRPVGGRARTAQ